MGNLFCCISGVFGGKTFFVVFLRFPKYGFMKKFVVSVFVGSLLFIMGCASFEKSYDSKPTEPANVGSVKNSGFEGSLPAGEILVGVSLNVQNPEKIADDIAQRYGGKVVGSLPELREYQLRFPVTDIKKMSVLRDEISKDSAVSFVF